MSQQGPAAFPWTWDHSRNEYYYAAKDALGNTVYHFQNGYTIPASEPRTTPTVGVGVGLGHGNVHYQSDSRQEIQTPPEPASHEEKRKHRDFIEGTPDKGWSETLDSSYQMRTGAEAHEFFRVGKVFAMLHIQACSETDLERENENVSVVKYGERAFSQIRRFVIVDSRRGFVYACPISTYSKRGTLKHGCVSSEHSIVYLNGSTPVPFAGEVERGLRKKHICINPVHPSVRIDAASRLHYAKAYPVEKNVKVKDIGDVDPAHLSYVLQYYREENGIDSTNTFTHSQTQVSPQNLVPGHPAQSHRSHSYVNPGYQSYSYGNSGYPSGYQQDYQPDYQPGHQSGYYQY